MSGIGAASFVEGLQGGIDARDKMDRNKQFKQMRKLGIAEKTNELADARGATMAELKVQAKEGGYEFDQAGFDEDYAAFEQDKDPALLRFGKWMGGKMSGMFGGKGEEGAATAQMDISTPAIQPPGPQASGATTYAMPEQTYADGGMMRRGYADGGGIEESDEMKRQRAQAARSTAALERRRNGEDAGGMREFGNDLARAAGNVFDDTIAGAEGGQKLIDEADAQLDSASNAREYGTAVRGTGAAALTSAAETTGGLLKDVFVDNPITQGVAGFLGFDGQGGEQQGIPAATDVPSTPEGDAIGASVDNPDVPAAAIAEKVIAEASDEAIENFDYKLLVDQGVRPEELPGMTTKDWSEYRRKITMHAMRGGSSPAEAHKMVDDRITQTQMAGFQREARKASEYLKTGQNREAAMALRQAYQYFPNGTTVKFGTMTDPKTGQPAIMTMGFDEETGEPSGSPMLIDMNRLNSMVENFSNPQAFRTWTKDGQDLQMEINKLQSVDDYRQGSLGIAGYRADTDRIDAMTGGGAGGISASERRQRDQTYAKAMAESGIMEEGFEDPGVVRSLASAMSIYERMSPGLDTNTVMHEVVTAYQSDPETGVQRLLEAARGQ